MRFLTWLTVALIAMPLGSARAIADNGGQDIAQMQMSMPCDHSEATAMASPQMASPQSEHDAGQSQHQCCVACDMPDCATGSAGPALPILTGEMPEALLSKTETHKLLGDLTQISVELATPRKPPRV